MPAATLESPLTGNYAAVQSVELLRNLVEALIADGKPIGFDIETGYDGPDCPGQSLDPTRNKVVGFSFTNDPRWARYVPLAHDLGPNIDDYDVAVQLMERLVTTLACVCHNLKFEKRNLRYHFGIEIKAHSDSQLECFLLSEFKSVGLKQVTLDTFGHKQMELVDLFPNITKKQKDCIRFNVLDLSPPVIAYACEDAAACLAHSQRNLPRVKDMLLYPIEMEIIDYLCDMEDVGVHIDWRYMRDKAAEGLAFSDKQLAEVYSDFAAILGRPVTVNINSPVQLGKILYDEMGLEVYQRSAKTEQPGTGKVALEKHSRNVPVVRKILRRRQVAALVKRYLNKWPDQYSHSPDHRARPSYNQFVVGTGRFAAKDPAIQQSPKKPRHALTNAVMDDLYKKDIWDAIAEDLKFSMNFRDSIIASPGFYLFDFDYKQVELRGIAGLAGETVLIETFANGGDPHTTTASIMLGIPAGQITPEQRAIGKTMNFALIYGMGVSSLAQRLAISKERAQQLYDAFFAGYPAIKIWSDNAKLNGKARGYTVSKFGRKYTVWELQSPNRKIYAKGERVLGNAPVQGYAADYMKIAMVRLRRTLISNGMWLNTVFPIMNNHDSLTFEVSESIDPKELAEIFRPAIEFPVAGMPPCDVDFNYGPKWGSMDAVFPKSLDDEDDMDFLLDEDDDEDGDEEEGELPITEVPLELIDAIETVFAESSARAAEQPTPGSPLDDQTLPPTPSAPAAQPPSSPEHDGTTLEVSITDMPTDREFAAFIAICEKQPGPTLLVLVTPEGNADIALVSDTPGLRAEIQVALRTAVIVATDIDTGTLTEGLTL